MIETPAASRPWGAPPEAAEPQPAFPTEPEMKVDFAGRRGALFWLALKTGFFTVLTLGFYRFWMKTRLRRWYWSAIRPGGHPMEYVGDPIEKLLGFFIAVVILTFYIGILNLFLMFASFSLFSSSVIGYLASFAGVIPIWFYATYRARRYVLARTRWRGVRFGLEPGAWGYAWRALVHWAITFISLGLLWPRMTFWLEKYKTDRTYFGSARLHQGGRWPMLYRAARPLGLVLLFILGIILSLVVIDPMVPFATLSDAGAFARQIDIFLERGAAAVDWHNPYRLWGIPISLILLVLAAVYYRWDCKRILANHKTAPGLRFHSALNGWRVMLIYVLGNTLSYLVLTAGVVGVVVLAWLGFGEVIFDQDAPGRDGFAGWPRVMRFVTIGVLYLGVFLLWGVLHNTFVTFPLMRHMAITTHLPDPIGLADISQRARDEADQAEGFAEALDLGAAI